ncbi:hypothetical protein ACIHIX_20600 [Streptomyces sp. NPDC051913]|uniref:hypothetical protein n=1 Tax=Streptomyces sp. NPDC051913 TaxID=3365676 RepID=UPI0037D6442D
MSTEARHASIPPRPTAPPRPTEPPTTSEPIGDDATAEQGTRRSDQPSAARNKGAAEATGTTGDRRPSTRASAPERTSPATSSAPPPPRASARFPDTPPKAGHASRTRDAGSEAPATDSAEGSATVVPPRPAQRPPAPWPATPPRRTGASPEGPSEPTTPPQRTGAPPEGPSETTFRLRPIPAERAPRRESEPDTRWSPLTPGPPASGTASSVHPDPALSWSAPLTSGPASGTTPGSTTGSARPVVSFGEPEGYDENARPRSLAVRAGVRTAAVAVCLVLGLGLIGGAVTGSWLVGDSAAAGAKDSFAAAAELWHSVPVDQLFPPTVQGQGAGPGGADRTWTRIAVAADTGCKDAFDPLLQKALAPVGCSRLLRATYTDATQSYVTTVGLLFTKADVAGMTALDTRFTKEGLGTRADLMPHGYAAKDTAAADFGGKQRASWTISVLTDAPVVVYAVSGWADGRTVDEPQAAAAAMQSGATTAVAQAGLGHEAQGLADRVERGLRRTVGSPATEGTERTS